MDLQGLDISQLSYMYEHGDYLLKAQATAQMSAIQLSQCLSEKNATVVSPPPQSEAGL